MSWLHWSTSQASFTPRTQSHEAPKQNISLSCLLVRCLLSLLLQCLSVRQWLSHFILACLPTEAKIFRWSRWWWKNQLANPWPCHCTIAVYSSTGMITNVTVQQFHSVAFIQCYISTNRHVALLQGLWKRVCQESPDGKRTETGGKGTETLSRLAS